MKYFNPILLVFSLISSAICLSCPTGFSSVNGKCLRIFRTNLKHLEAENDCSYLGGTLVTIKNAVDNRAVTNLAASSGAQKVWIGVFCFATGNTTTCYHDDDSGALTYSQFAAGNPQISGNGGCVYLSTNSKTTGQWFSAPCEIIGLPFICEVPPTVPDPTCTHNFNGYCYTPSYEMLTGTNTTTYPKAQALCQAANSNLVSIHSKNEVDYIRAIFRASGVEKIFLGAQSFLQDTFDWVDGSNFDYDYTDPLSTTKGNCLMMDLSSSRKNNGLWSEINCQTTNFFLCKRKMFSAVPEIASAMAKTKHSSSLKGIKGEKVNPKYQKAALPRRQELLDYSNCNSTIFMAPGVITSFGYPNPQPPKAFCIWNLAVLGPYRIAVYFTDFSVSSYQFVYMYDEYGNLIYTASGYQSPFSVLGSTNIMKLTHDSSGDASFNRHGFEATVLPY